LKDDVNPFSFLVPLDGLSLDKYLVKTDCMRFLEHYYDRNASYSNFVLTGPRGSGKTTCLWHLLRFLFKERENLPIYSSVAFYSSIHYKSEPSRVLSSTFFLSLYEAMIRSFVMNESKYVKEREMKKFRYLTSLYQEESFHQERLDDLPRRTLQNISSILERIAERYHRLIFLVDEIDKFPFSNLKNIAESLKSQNLVLTHSSPLEVSFVCAANPIVGSDLSQFLRVFSQKETIIVDVDWDIGYWTEVVRRRLEDVTERRLKDFLDDDALFELYRGADKNPRNSLVMLSQLFRKMSSEKPMPLFDISSIVREYRTNFRSGKNEVTVENEFKSKLKPHWAKVLSARTKQDKGHALEALLRCLFESVDGLSIAGTNVRTSSEELDILLRNETTDRFLGNFGTPVLVECKKWGQPVGSKDINWFVSKVKRRSLRVGIFVAWEGITGSERSDAGLEIKRALEAGITIVVITKEQLMKVYGPRDFLYTLKECYYSVYKL
jgi:energy-coupling factor transporter ATP-binding protein EcfA2